MATPPPPDDPPTIPLTRHPGLHINPSTPKGRGVYTTQPIPSGATIDTCPVLILSPGETAAHIARTSLHHYTYNWPLLGASGRPSGTTQAIVFGLGSMFNHSARAQNVGWHRDLARQVVVYRALRDIAAGEELCISYGERLTFQDADGPAADDAFEGEHEDELLEKIQLEV